MLSQRLFLLLLTSSLAAATAVANQERAKELARLMEIERGDVIADVGAGDGDWSIALAREVGPEGRVYAQEIDSSEIRKIERAVKRADLENVTPILGDKQQTKLDDECCDAVLLRTVYHHFSHPEEMRAELWRILKPGKVIAVVDFAPRGRSSRHGVSADDLISEMTGSGFELIGRHDGWENEKNRFLLLFRKVARSDR